jgi:hypothetical protein
MIFLQDVDSVQNFLVYTSAAVGILSHCSFYPPSDPSISVAEGKNISC